MRSLVGKVAQVCNRTAELLSTLVSVLVASAFVDYSLVFLKVGVDVGNEVFRKVKLRKDRVFVYLVAFYLFGDLKCVAQGLGMLVEEIKHFFLALKILLLGIPHPVRVVYKYIGGQTDKPVVSGTVLLAYEMHVIGRHHLCPSLFRQLEDAFVDYGLLFIHFQRLARNLCLMELDFKVEILTKYLLVPCDGLFRALHVASENVSRHLSCNTCGAADQVLCVLLHDLVGYARLFIILSLDVASGHYLHQIPVAVVVLGQQDEVIVSSMVLVLQLMVIVLRHIYLAAYDRLHLRELLRCLEELLHTIHIAVVGYRQSRHTKL